MLNLNAEGTNKDRLDCENETYEHMVVTTPIELFLEEDEGLSALEKVYLFSRSDSSFHRWVPPH